MPPELELEELLLELEELDELLELEELLELLLELDELLELELLLGEGVPPPQPARVVTIKAVNNARWRKANGLFLGLTEYICWLP